MNAMQAAHTTYHKALRTLTRMKRLLMAIAIAPHAARSKKNEKNTKHKIIKNHWSLVASSRLLAAPNKSVVRRRGLHTNANILKTLGLNKAKAD
jgi:hypothetical protein